MCYLLLMQTNYVIAMEMPFKVNALTSSALESADQWAEIRMRRYDSEQS